MGEALRNIDWRFRHDDQASDQELIVQQRGVQFDRRGTGRRLLSADIDLAREAPVVRTPERPQDSLVDLRPATTVAIVNHQPMLCESLSAMLTEETGLRVVGSATSARGAHDLVSNQRPDVLILDAEFDAVNAMDLLDELHSANPRLVVVVLMSDDDKTTAARALQKGAKGFVLKSAPIHELVEATRWAVKGQVWMSPPLLTGLLQTTPQAPSPENSKLLSALTKRELEVLRLLVEGLGHTAISARLHVSTNTIRTHCQNLQRKLGVHSAVAAVSVALDAGLRPAA
jgi:DNA-binding NarL/FixJ family response regulator